MSENKTEVKNGNVSNGSFLGENLSVVKMPDRFYLGDEIKYGLLALKKWSKAQGFSDIPDLEGKEVSGVLFMDPLNRIQLRDLSIGTIALVETDIEDLTKSSNGEIRKRLCSVPMRIKGQKKFILIPAYYSEGYPKISKVIVEKGRILVGTVHVHPSGDPPGGGDFANFLLSPERVGTVVSDDEVFIFIRGNDSFNLPIEQYSEYRESLEKEFDVLIEDKKYTRGEHVNILIGECIRKRVAFYRANLEDCIFQRLA